MSASPTKVTLSAAGYSAWIPLNAYISPFNVSLGCVCSSDINATYSVQYSFDSPHDTSPCTISRSTVTATLSLVNHGLTTSDSVIVSGSGDSNLDGTYQVASVVDQNTITYTVANTGAIAAAAQVATMRVFTHSTIAAKIANNDGNIAYPVQVVRLYISSYTAGYITLIVSQAGRIK